MSFGGGDAFDDEACNRLRSFVIIPCRNFVASLPATAMMLREGRRAS